MVFGTESRDRIVILFLSLLCVLSALGPGMKVLLDCALLPLTPLPPCHIWLYLLVTWYQSLPSNQRLQLPYESRCCSLLEVSGSPAICRGCGEAPISMSILWRSQREHSYKEMRNKAEWTCASGPRHTFQYTIGVMSKLRPYSSNHQ